MTVSKSETDWIYHGRLWDFHGGIHPPENKSLSNQSPIEFAGVPDELILPLLAYGNVALHPVVKVGDKILKGQVLARAENDESASPLLASCSGVVKALEPRPSTHPSQLEINSLVIETDKAQRWIGKRPMHNYQSAKPEDLIKHLRESGIVGLGGAIFPTFKKLQNSEELDYLLINGAECEPYISCDDRLMRERADTIIAGIEILIAITKPKQVLIAIEDNKPEAIEAMKAALDEKALDACSIAVLPSKYPSGGEKQLIKILTGKEVAHDKLPIDIGMLMQNVATCYAIAKAVLDGEPCLSRIVTVSGQNAKKPGNYETLIGTPLRFLIEQQKESSEQPVIMGGPMMGVKLKNLAAGIGYETNCLILAAEKELINTDNEAPCIRCGQCATVCPAQLLPQQLYWFGKSDNLDKAEDYHIMDCIECGACAYVCPSQIPLVHYYRYLKSAIRNRRSEHEKAERARQRFEFRQERLEREKKERAERHRKAAAERRAQAEANNETDAKKQAVLDAVARVKAKKNNDSEPPSS